MKNINESYNRQLLPNGLAVVSEEIPYLKSVSIGILVNTGSVDEINGKNGISHFIEHLAFKGTKKRTAYQIASEMDSIGGQIDAYTSKEHTFFSARILGEHLPIAIDILSDILTNSLFKKEDIEKERNVILEEIKMTEDSPTDCLSDLFYSDIFKGHPLGQPIQGTEETVNSLTRDDIISYLDGNYFADNIIITGAGNMKHDNFFELISDAFSKVPNKKKRLGYQKPVFNKVVNIKDRDLEQIHFCLGVEGIASSDDDRYKLYLLNTIFGSSMSSRLFQKIREDKGLVYNIYSFNNYYDNTGVYGVYAAASMEAFHLTVELIFNEIRELINNKVPADDLMKAKDQLTGNILLSLESSTSRMNQLARQEVYFGRRFTIEEICKSIDEVTVEDIQYMAERLFKGKSFSLTALGDGSGIKITKEMLVP